MTDNLIDSDYHPRLTAEEVGPFEKWNIDLACERFKSFDKARWHAERYGAKAVTKIHHVLRDIQANQQSRKTCESALDAYNYARMAHHGWRALRGI